MGCPVCSEQDTCFHGRPQAELEHHAEQALHHLHELRRALARKGPGLPDIASGIINELDELVELIRDWKVA